MDLPLPEGFAIGEYVVERELGRGGMGAVYAARHPIIGQRVAIKVLSAACASSAALVERFVTEARASSRIGHPNIIQVFAFGQLADGRHYFVMEYMEGETLEERLERGSLPPADALRFLTQICRALAAAHEANIVHRDLKPENIWIAMPRHAEPFVKLLDFGVAKLLDDKSGLGHTTSPIGTPLYMAPEQCLGRPVDARTDLYALGVILFRMFTGYLPFDGSTFAEVITGHVTQEPPAPSSLRPMDAGLERLLLSCLSKDPALRPPSALDVAERLAVLKLPGPGPSGRDNSERAVDSTQLLRHKSPLLAAGPEQTDAPVVTGRAGAVPARSEPAPPAVNWQRKALIGATVLAGGGLFVGRLFSGPSEPEISHSAELSAGASISAFPVASSSAASVAPSIAPPPPASASVPAAPHSPSATPTSAHTVPSTVGSPSPSHTAGAASGLVTENPYGH